MNCTMHCGKARRGAVDKDSILNPWLLIFLRRRSYRHLHHHLNTKGHSKAVSYHSAE